MADGAATGMIDDGTGLGARLGRLIATLREQDGFDLGPQEQSFASEIAAVVAMAPAEVDRREALLQLRGSFQAVLAKSAAEAAIFRDRFDVIFEMPAERPIEPIIDWHQAAQPHRTP